MNRPEKDKEGKYQRWAWPGGYPLYYVTKGDYATLCPSCADKNADDVFACDINWEDPMLWCEVCNQRIESAYAEEGHPDAEDKAK